MCSIQRLSEPSACMGDPKIVGSAQSCATGELRNLCLRWRCPATAPSKGPRNQGADGQCSTNSEALKAKCAYQHFARQSPRQAPRNIEHHMAQTA